MPKVTYCTDDETGVVGGFPARLSFKITTFQLGIRPVDSVLERKEKHFIGNSRWTDFLDSLVNFVVEEED